MSKISVKTKSRLCHWEKGKNICTHQNSSPNLYASSPNKLPDRINLKEWETKEKCRSTNQYCCCFCSPSSPCGKAKTNKQGQLASNRLVRLWEQTAEGFISRTTECSLNLKHLKTHWQNRVDSYSIRWTHWMCTMIQTQFLMMIRLSRVKAIIPNWLPAL